MAVPFIPQSNIIKAVPYSEIIKLAVREQNEWAVYVSNGLQFITESEREIWSFISDEVLKLYPENPELIIHHLIDGGLFFFPTETAMDSFYRIFDAPLTDSSVVYAATYSPDGECLTENT